MPAGITGLGARSGDRPAAVGAPGAPHAPAGDVAGMRALQYWHRKVAERKKDGTLLSGGDCLGPPTLAALELFLERALAI